MPPVKRLESVHLVRVHDQRCPPGRIGQILCLFLLVVTCAGALSSIEELIDTMEGAQ